MKTNAVRLLDDMNVQYELRNYEVDANDLAAETVAAKLGLPPNQVFKTLLVKGDGQAACFAVIPGDAELDLKALARVSGNRKAEMAPLKDVQPLTGYIRGGVTALAAKKPFPVYLDESARSFDRISISAGARGTQILIAPGDYIRITGATEGAIANSKR